MNHFPKRYCLPDGSIYQVTLENVRADYAFTVRQFEDLSEQDKERQIAAFDEEQALTWMSDQWEGNEITTWGTDTGEVDEQRRAEALRAIKHSMAWAFASELEIK